jgi:hypothetical protein
VITFSKMPARWQTQPQAHAAIRAVPVGEAIAAMKLYMTLCLRTNFKASDLLPEPGSVRRPLTQLCTWAGVSKPMAIAGLRHAAAWQWITVAAGKPTTYRITGYNEPHQSWAKLPTAYLAAGAVGGKVRRLHDLSNRLPITCNALQMYLYLACIRDRLTGLARVGYERLTEVLALDRNQIASTISFLLNHELITMRKGEVDEFSAGEHASNVYWLRGLDHKPSAIQSYANAKVHSASPKLPVESAEPF